MGDDTSSKQFQEILDSMVFVNTPKKVPPPPKERAVGRDVAKSYCPSEGWDALRPRRKSRKELYAPSTIPFVPDVMLVSTVYDSKNCALTSPSNRVYRHPVADVKWTRTWNHPVEKDQNIPQPTLDTCTVQVRRHLADTVNDHLRKVESEHSLLPSFTETQVKERIQAAIGLSDYKMVQSKLRSVSPKRVTWTSSSSRSYL